MKRTKEQVLTHLPEVSRAGSRTRPRQNDHLAGEQLAWREECSEK